MLVVVLEYNPSFIFYRCLVVCLWVDWIGFINFVNLK